MAVQDITFARLAQLKSAARNAHFTSYTHGVNAEGKFYFTSYVMDPRVVAIVAAQDAKAREAAAKRVATGVEPTPKLIPRKSTPGVKLYPITKQIRDWVHAHPNCVKAEALAAFPGVNPSTVGVQFGKAKRGEV